MKLTVNLTGASPKYDGAILERASEVLSQMQSEFSNLNVEIDDGKPKAKEVAETGEDRELAGDSWKSAAEGPIKRKAKTRRRA